MILRKIEDGRTAQRRGEMGQQSAARPDKVLALAFSLVSEAIKAAREGAFEQAVELLRPGFTFPASQAAGLEKWLLFGCLCANLEAALCTDGFGGAWDQRRGRNLETTFAELLNSAEAARPEPGQHTDCPLVDPLSERELEVLHLIAEGLSNAEIAQKLFISLGTVKVHTRNIYGKLGVSNRVLAVMEAQRLNLL